MTIPIARSLLGAAGALTIAAAALVTASAVSTSASNVLVFDDRASGLRLTIEADPAAHDAGMFAFSVDGRGTYVSDTPAELKVASPASINVAFTGSVTLTSESGATAQFPAELQAHLDPIHHTAEATLTTDRDRYHLVTRPADRAGLENVLRTFEAAALAGDWGTLYDISSSDYTESLTRDAFVAMARSQTATAGTIAKLRRLKAGDIATNPLGFSYIVVPYERTRIADGVSRVDVENVYFLYEGDRWRVWFGVAR